MSILLLNHRAPVEYEVVLAFKIMQNVQFLIILRSNLFLVSDDSVKFYKKSGYEIGFYKTNFGVIRLVPFYGAINQAAIQKHLVRDKDMLSVFTAEWFLRFSKPD